VSARAIGSRLLLPTAGTKFAALALVVLLGLLDYATGHHFALSAFYLIPISWGCWVGGRRMGLAFAVLSAGVWLAADLTTSHLYRHPAIPYWNTLTLLTLFVVVVYLLSVVQSATKHLEETVRRRTEALQIEISERRRLEQAIA
jgi:hypothetical protein